MEPNKINGYLGNSDIVVIDTGRRMDIYQRTKGEWTKPTSKFVPWPRE